MRNYKIYAVVVIVMQLVAPFQVEELAWWPRDIVAVDVNIDDNTCTRSSTIDLHV